jgi:pSer/pThr/pTyr-binding forkhead associated (FHA) protein
MVEVKLKVQAGSNSGKEIPVPVSPFVIGRSSECQLRPKSDAISRNHCSILISDQTAIVRDLNSRNGTFVNGQQIKGDHPLKDGDVLQVGKLEFVVVMATTAQAPAVPAPDTKQEKKVEDGSSMEFDVSEWLEEASVSEKKRADPDTRQFKLDETDRIALEKAAASEEGDEEAASKKFTPPTKKPPGKLPDRNKQAAANSREAAADMLKKFFNNK